MNTRTRSILVVFLCSLVSFSYFSTIIQANERSHFIYDGEGVLSLDGVWKVANEDFASWSEHVEHDDWEFLEVPHRLFSLDRYDYNGSIAYQTSIDVQQTSEQQLALYIPNRIGNFRLWINEEQHPAESQVIIPFESDQDDVQIVIIVEEYLVKSGGLYKEIKFGAHSDIVRKYSINEAMAAIPLSGLALFGICYLAFYRFYRNMKQVLYYGLFMLTVVFLMIVQSGYLANLAWIVEYKLIVMSLFMVMLFLYLYAKVDFTNYSNPFIERMITWLSIVSLIVIPFIPISSFQLWGIVVIHIGVASYIMYLLVRAVIEKHPNGIFNFIGVCLLGFLVILEWVFIQNIYYVGTIFAYGITFHIFLQFINYVISSLATYIKMEEMKRELQGFNASLELKIRERTLRLQERTEQLQHVNNELSKLESMRRQLLADVTHELGGPLTTIQGYVRGMLDGVLPNPSKNLLVVYEKSQLMERFLDDLHALSSLEVQQLSFEYERVEFVAFTRTLVRQFEQNVNETEVKVTFQSEDASLFVTIDPLRIEQVFINLIGNAQKFSQPSASITVSVHSDEHFAHVSIKDEGKGIPDTALPYVFDRSFQVDREKRFVNRQGGSGLGLAICREIITRHHGRISAESELEVGSVFYFSLPLDTDIK
ncbi:cell wall metabolism sensor histidine kinase WalK [Geomicrobium sp. JCM 19038]|uniref:sensor histidine kinase n=1 Tax=Geomicrobium sp. JCM 19038 TaxID=1460635 RepID=UPI00045F4703|nr:ATP-binding protein [Geomicrobium sp. JCM 19038]GAK08392.1 phosphate regulon sensor protein PhoR [Geomicrobium sp. JCM 19038]